MELGLYSFGEVMPGSGVSPHQRTKDLVEEIALADEVGLDVFGVGEHHREDYIVSAPAVVLAAAASITKKIRLTSAVTVLSSDDPVRVFQSFSTLDLLSDGRAEIMVGRGSFIESFPLFGYDLDDYESLFESKLELLLELRDNETVTWTGRHRAPLEDIGVYPQPVQNPLPIWVAVGGTPASVVRAAEHKLPLAIAIIGGMPAKFKPLVSLYRASSFGQNLPLSINSHGYLATTSQEAADEYYPRHQEAMTKLGRERGWPPMGREHFDFGIGPSGALFVGSPQQVIDKILAQHEMFGHQRFLLQLGIGGTSHEKIMRSIELYGTVVAPAVRAATGARAIA